jgi:hypothetical protein
MERLAGGGAAAGAGRRWGRNAVAKMRKKIDMEIVGTKIFRQPL